MGWLEYKRVVEEKKGWSWYDGEVHPEIVSTVLGRRVRGRSYDMDIGDYEDWLDATDMDMIHGCWMWRWGRIDEIDKWGRKVFRRENMEIGDKVEEPDWGMFKNRLENLCKIKGDRGIEWTLYNPTMLASNGLGMEKFCFGIADRKQEFKDWLEKIDEVVAKELDLILSYPVEVVKATQIFASKTGLYYDKEWIEEVEFEHLRRRVDESHKAGRLVSIHCDGVTEWLMGRFIDIGIDVWRGWEGKDWYEDYGKWGKKIAFHGTVLVDNLVRKTSEEIRAEVIDKAMGRPQIISSAHCFSETGIPFKNFQTVMQEAIRIRDSYK